ncbi:GDYXXLXY domain-containing protein [Nostoc parmelioides]|uniref:GDYXXLXY domain-containing protein n=1 Tax=Nostoc parmelioides FACHB-3921 TaxID=2692909 RepID=A0ABR8BBZ7_9NOSO|nr:GDYXXLXY domain-containing protein [Nostoc parmelioides]MBD2251608.1 GDYXXLXY domain-containing protein [Nostoc parmelioides FACHB-3921]
MASESSESGKSKTLSPEAEFSKKLTFRDYLAATEQKSNQPLPFWRLLLPLILQTGLILSVPTQAMYTNITGREVILQTLPADPDNVLRGYTLNLDYNISRISNLRRLPGWEELLRRNRGRGRQLVEGTNLYVILQEQQSFGRGTPRAWRPVRVSSNLPMSLRDNQVALRGVYQNGFINYGVESYNVPDEQRQQLNNDIFRAARQTRNGQLRPLAVKVKVDPQGNAVPMSLWVRDRNYRF